MDRTRVVGLLLFCPRALGGTLTGERAYQNLYLLYGWKNPEPTKYTSLRRRSAHASTVSFEAVLVVWDSEWKSTPVKRVRKTERAIAVLQQ